MLHKHTNVELTGSTAGPIRKALFVHVRYPIIRYIVPHIFYKDGNGPFRVEMQNIDVEFRPVQNVDLTLHYYCTSCGI